MSRYHINPSTQKPSKCQANPGNCPFKTSEGSETPHYASIEKARASIEKENKKKYSATTSISKNQKILQEVEPGVFYMKDEYGREHYYNSEGKLHHLNKPALKHAQDQGEYWYKNGLLHRVGKPAVTTGSGRIEYWKNGKLHNPTGAAIFDPDGEISAFYVNGVKHREGDKPAVIYQTEGRYEHYQHGKLHRANNKPAIWTSSGYREFRENDKLHNLNGAAIIHDDGREKEYYVNGVKLDPEDYQREILKRVESGRPVKETLGAEVFIKVNGVLHNPSGAAIVNNKTGRKDFYIYGVKHNNNGPAVTFPSGTVEYWWLGVNLSKKEYEKKRMREDKTRI